MFVLFWLSCQISADTLKTAVAAVAASNCGYDKKCAVCPMSSYSWSHCCRAVLGSSSTAFRKLIWNCSHPSQLFLKLFQAETKHWVGYILVLNVLMLITWFWVLGYFIYRLILANIFVISNNAKKQLKIQWIEKSARGNTQLNKNSAGTCLKLGYVRKWLCCSVSFFLSCCEPPIPECLTAFQSLLSAFILHKNGHSDL